MAPRIKTGGRKKGSTNKVTRDVREAIAVFAQENVEKMSEWLNQIDDPAKRLDLYLRALEYHVPKLSRAEVSANVTVTAVEALKELNEQSV